MCYGSGSQFSFLGVIWIWTFKDVHFLLPPVEKTLKNPFPSVLVAKLNILKTWIFHFQIQAKRSFLSKFECQEELQITDFEMVIERLRDFHNKVALKRSRKSMFYFIFFLERVIRNHEFLAYLTPSPANFVSQQMKPSFSSWFLTWLIWASVCCGVIKA